MPGEKEIKTLFDYISRMNVLVIGDVMLDSYIWGKVDRISPEAPVPIVTVVKRENRLGGAANVALNVQSLGANPIICSIIGNDEKANTFIEIMKQQKLNIDGLLKSKNRITTTKFRVIGNNAQLLRVDEEIDNFISEEASEKLFNRIKKLIDGARLKRVPISAIIFQDYDKGVIKPELIEKIVSLAKSLNIIVTVDPKKRCFLEYKNVNLFKPNLKELNDALKLDLNLELPGSSFQPPASIKNAVNLLHSKQNIDIVLLTLAANGVYVSQKNQKSKIKNQNYLIPAHKRNIADVSGAGDTVISIATLCLALGLPVKKLAEISNLAGGLVCEQIGVVPIDKKLLMQELVISHKTKD